MDSPSDTPPTPPADTPPPSSPPSPGGQTPNDPLAIWSLVLGIAGILCCGFFTGIPGAILGHKASKRISASEGKIGGAGLARGGTIVSYLAILLSVVSIVIFAVRGPKLIEEWKAQMEALEQSQPGNF